ncbi:MAG: glutamate--tRNA ligase [Bryobacterales bacterium]|nr:glutamate--tRNA ligase [Bryobacterales bacterium]MEB2362744.1 glutamate--tRNA ligase [Bryobacterales bacterium]
MSEVRTRFAPSPTGWLHIGGVRTALFEILFAHHHGGSAILRIDDTDRERLVPGAIHGLLEDFRWLGLDFDEGPSDEEIQKADGVLESGLGIGGPFQPYVQSQRLPRYREVAEELIRLGHAYRCDCTPERLQKEREEQAERKEAVGYSGYCRDRNVPSALPHVVRFKIPANRAITLSDAVKGEVHWETIILRDPVLLKSDGYPTYHLATVADDHDMKISHVLRADEWLSTAPLHLLLYEALGWEAPVFAHLPPVLGSDGKKLSKRHGATFLRNFREAGYLPEAILNFMALIGWSPGGGEEEEIFTLDELTRRFSLDRVQNAGGVFSYDKLKWMNGVYIRRLSTDDLEARLRPFLVAAGLEVDNGKLLRIVPHIQTRLELLPDAIPLVDFLFKVRLDRDLSAMLKKGMDAAKARDICLQSAEALAGLPAFDAASIEAALRKVAEKSGAKSGAVFTVVRIAATGKTVTPPLFESIFALGQAQSIERLRETAGLLSAVAAAGSQGAS